MVPVDIWDNYMWKESKIQTKMYFWLFAPQTQQAVTDTRALDFSAQFTAIKHFKVHFISISFIGFLKQPCWRSQYIIVLTLREKINQMFVPIGERPSCDPVDVQCMSEARKWPIDDSFKTQIMRISRLEETHL